MYSSGSIDEHITRVAGERATPGRVQLLELANEFSIKKAELIIDQVQAAISNWQKIATVCGVSEESKSRIQKRLLSLRD